MTIAPPCDYCHAPLTEFGGILFSPPDATGMVRKWHVCVECYDRIVPTEGAAPADTPQRCWEGGQGDEAHLWQPVEGTADAERCQHCGSERNRPAEGAAPAEESEPWKVRS